MPRILSPALPLTFAGGLAAALLTLSPAQAATDDFDLQAHRGGLGLTVESTLPAFAQALAGLESFLRNHDG